MFDVQILLATNFFVARKLGDFDFFFFGDNRALHMFHAALPLPARFQACGPCGIRRPVVANIDR